MRARAGTAVWETGDGPPVLLVHGFPDHPEGLFALATELAASGYRCLLPALPGYAPSEPAPDGDYSGAAVGEDLISVLDSLKIESVAYVGHDWGAELGYPLLAQHPERFTCMVGIAAPHPSGYAVRRTDVAELRTAWYAMFLAYVPGAAQIARDPDWLRGLVRSWSPTLRWEEWPAIAEWLCRPGVMEAVSAYYRANLDAPPAAPVVPVPTTILHGSADGCIGPAAYPDFSRFFPAGVEVHELAGVGHWPQLEAPAATLAAIEARLASVGSAPG
ncbi:MAG: alpha/beta hydrolase [Solirubrobacterales bacterium]